MRVDVFLRGRDAPLRPGIERVLAHYAGLLEVRWHGPEAGALYEALRLASLPLDASTGHGSAGPDPYAGYRPSGARYLPAIAVHSRLALVDAPGGPAREVRPRVWEVPFRREEVLLAAFHRALEAAAAEVREAHRRLRERRPDLSEASAARLLEVTPPMLRRATRGYPGSET